jgi:nucleoside-diphosphate-sugar epimerase
MSVSLITGGMGSLGVYLSKQLLERGENVVVFDLRTQSPLAEDIMEKIVLIRGDFTELPHLLHTLRQHRVNHIFHLGAIQPQVGSEENLYATFRVNVIGTVNILEAAKVLEIDSVVFTGTQGTYAADGHRSAEEDHPQRPWDMYGVTKVCCDRLGEQYYRSAGVNFRALRLPPLPGVGRNSFGHSAFCDLAIIQPALGRPYNFNVAENALIPSVVYIKDAARALIELQRVEEIKLRRRIYNVSAMAFTAGELAQEVKKQIPDAKFNFQPDTKLMEALGSWPALDDHRAREDWGWEPEFDTLEKYVADVVAEVAKDPNKADPVLYQM